MPSSARPGAERARETVGDRRPGLAHWHRCDEDAVRARRIEPAQRRIQRTAISRRRLGHRPPGDAAGIGRRDRMRQHGNALPARQRRVDFLPKVFVPPPATTACPAHSASGRAQALAANRRPGPPRDRPRPRSASARSSRAAAGSRDPRGRRRSWTRGPPRSRRRRVPARRGRRAPRGRRPRASG